MNAFNRSTSFAARAARQVALAGALLGAVVAAQAQTNSPVGVWQTIDDHTGQPKALVQISDDGSGALSGKLTDIGINDQFMKDLGATITPGTSALFVLVRKATPDKVLEGLKPFAGKGRILQTSLTKDKEDELRAFIEAKQA